MTRPLAVGAGLALFVVLTLTVWVAVLATPPARASGPTFSPTVTTDDSDNNGNCTLREAIEASVSNMAVDLCPAGHPSGPDRIELTDDTYELSNDLPIAAGGPIQIVGIGAERSAIDGNNGDIVFVLFGTADVYMEHVAIINGHAVGSGGGVQQNSGTLELNDVLVANNSAGQAGGGVLNLNGLLVIHNSVFTGNLAVGGQGGSAIFTGGATGGTSLVDTTIDGNGGPTAASGGGITVGNGSLTIRRSTISNNQTSQSPMFINAGGGIYHVQGTMTLANSTVSGNVAKTGGALFAGTGTTVTLTHVTIAENTAAFGTNGIDGVGTVNIRNSILANGEGNCDLALVSEGYNLEDGDDCALNAIGDLTNGNADLEPLADNGGATLTHMLGQDSQALSLVNGAVCVAEDQREVARPQGDGCDAGSVESALPGPGSATPTVSPSPTADPTATPTPTADPTATPTSTPEPSGTPTPTPSPTATPAGQQVVWGDHQCSGAADPIDALLGLRFDAGLSAETGACPELGQNVDVQDASVHPWGDVDCSGEPGPVDSLKILRHDAGLAVAQPVGCPDIGAPVMITPA